MSLRVEYFREPDDPNSLCWRLMPLAIEAEAARILALDGLEDARAFLGARGFRILDRAGEVVAHGLATDPPCTVPARVDCGLRRLNGAASGSKR